METKCPLRLKSTPNVIGPSRHCAVNHSLESRVAMAPCHLSLAAGGQAGSLLSVLLGPGISPQPHLQDLMDYSGNVASTFLQINACRSPAILPVGRMRVKIPHAGHFTLALSLIVVTCGTGGGGSLFLIFFVDIDDIL